MHKGRFSVPERTWELTSYKAQIIGQILGVSQEHRLVQSIGHSYGWPAAKKSAKNNKLAGCWVEQRSPQMVRSRLLYLHYQDSSVPIPLSVASFFLPRFSHFYCPFSLFFLHNPLSPSYPCFILLAPLHICLPLSFTSPCFLFSLTLLSLHKH